MPTRAEILFERLQSAEAIRGLIGRPEDADYDCKIWPNRADAARGMIAKAACGFANATGGIIVIGMKASGGKSGEPDVVQEAVPVEDTAAVASAALDIILQMVEPGIQGVRVEQVPLQKDGKSGFVLLLIPEATGSPRRAKHDWKFYVRVASGTLPMEYFQIEDRFGRRPRAALQLSFGEMIYRNMPGNATTGERIIRILIANEGRGLARFAALRIEEGSAFFQALYHGVDPSPWAMAQANSGWMSYRARSNDVLYPGEQLVVTYLVQRGVAAGPLPSSISPPEAIAAYFDFAATSITAEAVCDGGSPVRQIFNAPERLHTASLARK